MRWRIHLLCCLVLASQVGLWWAGHRDEKALRRQLRSEHGSERIETLFLLLERGVVDPAWGEVRLTTDLLASQDLLEVEFANIAAVCKHGGAGIQYRRLKDMISAGQVTPHFWRSFVLLRRKIGVAVGGSSGRLGLKELEWWFDAQAERPLPADEVLEHIGANP